MAAVVGCCLAMCQSPVTPRPAPFRQGRQPVILYRGHNAGLVPAVVQRLVQPFRGLQVQGGHLGTIGPVVVAVGYRARGDRVPGPDMTSKSGCTPVAWWKVIPDGSCR